MHVRERNQVTYFCFALFFFALLREREGKCVGETETKRENAYTIGPLAGRKEKF